ASALALVVAAGKITSMSRVFFLCRYGVAVLSVIVATGVRLFVLQSLGPTAPFVTYLVAATFAAWYGGFGPAILVVFLGIFSASSFFIPPDGLAAEATTADWLALGGFAFVGVFVAFLSESLRSARARAEA